MLILISFCCCKLHFRLVAMETLVAYFYKTNQFTKLNPFENVTSGVWSLLERYLLLLQHEKNSATDTWVLTFANISLPLLLQNTCNLLGVELESTVLLTYNPTSLQKQLKMEVAVQCFTEGVKRKKVLNRFTKMSGKISLFFSSERLIYAGKLWGLWGHQSISLLH